MNKIFNVLLSTLVTVCAVVSLAFFSSCTTKNEPEKFTEEEVTITTPYLTDTTYIKEYVAEVHSGRNIEIRNLVKGIIEEISVDEGAFVREGQLLFTISSRAFQQELMQANAELINVEAELKTTEVEIENTQRLVGKNIISKTELTKLIAQKESVEAKIVQAKAAISIAKLNLSYSKVRAPFSGVIDRIPKKVGSLVDEGTLLTTISNNNEVLAYFNVSEGEYLEFAKAKKLNSNQKVVFRLANNELFNENGTIENAENEFDRSTGNIAFKAKFKNPQQLLKHGSSGKVGIEIKLKDALLIPMKSTFEVQDKLNVYVVDNENKVSIKSFTPKYKFSGFYVVESGLTVNDRFVLEGIQKVKEGITVKPTAITAKQAILAIKK